METVRLEGRLGKTGNRAIVQKVETIRNPDGSVEHMLSCYKMDIECNHRKEYRIGGILITTYCPLNECAIKRN